MVSEVEINRRFEVLTEQRNNALNQVVLAEGQIAELRATLKNALARIDLLTAIAESATSDEVRVESA